MSEEEKGDKGGGENAKKEENLTEEQKQALAKKKKMAEEADDDAIELNPNKNRVKKSRIITFYDPPIALPNDQVKRKENEEFNLLRRWRVEIFNIELTNLSGDTINPFIQFIIGGDYRIEYK
jgi:hypothetical protein